MEGKARAKESEDEPPAVRQKGAAGEAVNKVHDPPFKRFFNADPNKGMGDCFCLSAAKGLSKQSPSARTPTEKDFEPKGRLQAALRLIAQKEASRGKFKATTEIAEKVGTAGTAADSMAVRLTAEGTTTDMYVWCKLRGETTWTLYGREKNAKPKKKELWLKLEDQHYEHLSVKEGADSTEEYKATLAAWREKAYPNPTTGLRGKGMRGADEDSLSLLGLQSEASSSSKGVMISRWQGSVKSMLGLASSTTSPQKRRASSEKMEEDDIEDEGMLPYTPGDVNKCKCGWMPRAEPPNLSRKLRRQAVIHWRECQGKEPPKGGFQVHSAVSKWVRAAPHIKECIRERVLKKWEDWRKSLPKRVQKGACQLAENTVEVMKTKYTLMTRYRCTQCGFLRTPARLSVEPCPARPTSLNRVVVLQHT